MTDKIDDLEELAVKVERIFGDFWAVGKMIQEYQLNSGDKTGSSRAFYSKLSKLLVERMGNYTRPYINPKYLKGYVLLVELFPDKEEYLKAANGIGISPQVMMSDFSKEDFSWYAKEIKSMIMEGHQYIPVIMRETDYMRYKKEEKLDLYFPVLCSYIRACLPKKSQAITSEALDLLRYLYKDSSPVWMAEFFLDILQEKMMPKIRVKILDYM